MCFIRISDNSYPKVNYLSIWYWIYLTNYPNVYRNVSNNFWSIEYLKISLFFWSIVDISKKTSKFLRIKINWNMSLSLMVNAYGVLAVIIFLIINFKTKPVQLYNYNCIRMSISVSKYYRTYWTPTRIMTGFKLLQYYNRI